MTTCDTTSPNWPIHLGCPIWSCENWADEVYPAKTARTEWLKWYSAMFNSVEGNSTFYNTPAEETWQRWADQAAEGFRFCFKFPREISHDRHLVDCSTAMTPFMRGLETMRAANRLGPTFLQLGPQFSPQHLPELTKFLKRLSKEFDWAVELRHHDWYDSGPVEQQLNDVLSEQRVNKVLFDSRSLFQGPPKDLSEAEAQKRKPQTPVRQTITANRPMLRFVGRNLPEMSDEYLDQWVPIVAGWIRDGRQPFVFMHAPNPAFAPRLARHFLRRLGRALPNTPDTKERLTIPKPPVSPKQLSFLDG